MATIIQAAHRHQDAVHNAAAVVKEKAYTPAADLVLKGLSKGESVLSTPINRMANRTFEPVRGTGSVLTSAKNVAINYDVAVTKAGEKASRYAGAGMYYIAHMALSPISGCKAGRIIQEGIAQGLGFLVRGVGLVATFVIRALPYLAIAAALAFGGWKIGLGLAALYAITKIGFAFTLTATVLLGFSAGQQVQICRIGSKLSDAFKQISSKDATIQDLKNRLNKETPSTVGKKLKDAANAVAKRKMLLSGVLLAALGIGACYMFPEQATQMKNFVSANASNAYGKVCDISSQVSQNQYVEPVVSFFSNQ